MPRNSTTGIYTRVVNSFADPVLGDVIDPTDADAFFDDLTDALNDLPGALSTFTQSGTGAVERTAQNKERDTFNIKDFGAICNGVADDTAAIVAADIAAAAVNAKLYFPGGFILVSSTLTPSAKAHWIGEATELTTIYTSSASATTFVLSNADVIIENMRVVPSVVRNSTAIDFNITAAGRATIRNAFVSAGGTPFKIAAASGTILIDNCSTSNTVANGIDVDVNGCFIATISNCVFSGDPAARAFAHFVFRDIQGQIQLVSNQAFQGSHGIYAIPGTGQVVTLVKGLLNYIDNNPNGSLVIVPSGTGTVARVLFADGWLSSGAVLTGNGSNIDQVTIRDTDILTTGITVNVTATGVKRLQLVGNNLSGTSGYTLDGVVGAEVHRNKFISLSSTGLFLSNAADKIRVSDNDFSGCATPVTNTASGTDIRFRGNVGVVDSPAVPAAEGGTGFASYTVGDLLYASGATSLAKLLGVATGNALISGGVATAPAWGKIGLTTHISGTLGVANGGTGITAFGTGVATALGINVGSAGAFVTFNGAGGTPSSLTLTSATGLPVGSGISGLGTGIATALAVNVGTAGAPVVNGGALGSPSSAGTLPAHTLGGTISGGGNQINNVIIGTSTPLAGFFTTLSATGAFTYGGVTLSAAVTGTGNMVLSAGPTLTGTTTIATLVLTTVGAHTISGSITYGGVTLTNAVTGTGKMVLDTSPTLVTPALGAATATTINGAAIDNLAWSAFSPTLSANTGSLGTGNSVTGRQKTIGKTVFFQVSITIGASGVGTASYLKFSLPSTAAAQYVALGKRNDNGVSVLADSGAGTNSTMLINKYDATDPLANNATFVISGSYEST